MTDDKKFLKYYAVITLITIGLFIALNVYIDIYGLFLGRKERKVYVNERTSKYLLSFRYIPENYNGFIVGPSLSANLNPEFIENFRIYNSSIMGANISDLHYLIKNIHERQKMDVVIICLDPYLVKDFGKKSATIDPKEYYGALGSTNLLKTYLMYFIRNYELLPEQHAPEIISENGWNNFELEMKGLDAKRSIEEKVKLKRYEETKIDPRSYEELKEVLDELRKKNIRIVAYFSPVPYQIYSIGQKDYNVFENKMKDLFTPEDIVLNLNDEKYRDITADYNTFIDHGHLSAKGQMFVLTELKKHLQQVHAGN